MAVTNVPFSSNIRFSFSPCVAVQWPTISVAQSRGADLFFSASYIVEIALMSYCRLCSPTAVLLFVE